MSQSPRVCTALAYPALYSMKQLGVGRERQHWMKFLIVEGNDVMTASNRSGMPVKLSDATTTPQHVYTTCIQFLPNWFLYLKIVTDIKPFPIPRPATPFKHENLEILTEKNLRTCRLEICRICILRKPNATILISRYNEHSVAAFFMRMRRFSSRLNLRSGEKNCNSLPKPFQKAPAYLCITEAGLQTSC